MKILPKSGFSAKIWIKADLGWVCKKPYLSRDGFEAELRFLTVTSTVRHREYCLLCLFQDAHGLQTLSESCVKAEADNKLGVGDVLMLSADKSLLQQAVRLDASSVDAVQMHRGSGIEFSVKPSPASVDYFCRTTMNADLKLDSDVKPPYNAIRSDSLIASSDAAKAVVDETTLLTTSLDCRLVHDMPVFDSGRRVRWLSGVSCTSSSTSGGEESPLPGNSSSLPKQHPAQTLTPVNGWSDSTSHPSRHVFKEENDVGRRPRFADGLGNVNETHSIHVDGFSTHKLPTNFVPGVGPNSVPSVERTYPGVGHDNRSWSSSTASPQSHWNSQMQISEPFWATGASPFCPQNEGMSSPIRSPPRMGALQPAAVVAGCGFDASQMLSLNGSFSDMPNNMQMSQNVSPSSTPLATPSSKKRVCVLLFSPSVLLNDVPCCMPRWWPGIVR